MASKEGKFKVPGPQQIWKTASSRNAIMVLKGTLAYTLVFVLIFLTGFEDLFKFPITTTSAVIVTIAGFPGHSVGKCVAGTLLALIGVALGAFFFWVLAIIHSEIGQALVFFVIVYAMAYIKCFGMQYFGFALLCILNSFNGIYTSLLVGGYNKDYHLGYFKSYLWGAGIVLFVNIFVFPHTAEKELRMTLVASLNHIRTFTHLISKTYQQTITDEERQARDALNISIRADFGLLSGKLQETGVEINWSQWSMQDYGFMVSKTRAMQQALITTYSSLMGVEKRDLELFKDFLPEARRDFDKLHKAVFVSLSEISRRLNVGEWHSGPEAQYYQDLERAQSGPTETRARAPSIVTPGVEDETEIRLRAVEQRLQAELDAQTMDDTPMASRKPSLDGRTAVVTPNANVSSPDEKHSPAASEKGEDKSAPILQLSQPVGHAACTQALRRRWETFRNSQFERLGDIMASGQLHGHLDELFVEQPQPSFDRMWGADPIRGQLPVMDPNASTKDMLRTMRQRSRTRHGDSPVSPTSPTSPVRGQDHSPPGGDRSSDTEEDEALDFHHSLTRVYSFLFAMNSLIDSIVILHDFTSGVTSEDGKSKKPRKKRLHVHIFEGIRLGRRRRKAQKAEVVMSEQDGDHGREKPMTMREALSTLEGKPFVPVRRTIWERIGAFEMALRSTNSICALKTACGVTVVNILFLVPTTRVWATSYSLNSGLLTIVVALSPTLGQTALTFALQIGGQGVGYLYGMIILEIFHNVGGHKWNPYGLAVFLGLFAVPLCWIFYVHNPMLFPFSLLAMNSAGIIVCTEYIYRARPQFDNPPLRLGKGLAVLAIGLAISAIFQLLVLRNPARRTLRKAVAHVTMLNSSYMLILQAYVRATIPADPEHRASQAAIQRVEAELRKREVEIQESIIAVMPLLKFSAVEPSLSGKFDAKNWIRIIRSNQVMLDRMVDARIAIGNGPLDPRIVEHFVTKLSPYRRRSTRYIRACLYACTSALTAKLPLPHELPMPSEFLPAFFSDCLVLSSRMAQSGPEGLALVKSSMFTRYWLYLLSVTSTGQLLEEIAAAIKALFGELEDDIPFRSSFKDD